MAMTPNRPYMVRAFYDWIVDNGCTPYIVVNALETGVQVPQDYVVDGQIVLNLSPSSVVGMSMDLERVGFNARFGGIPMSVEIPMSAILGIYAKENGQGMVFQSESDPQPDPTPKGPRPVVQNKKGDGDKGGSSAKSGTKKPSLHVVK
ncbi:MAG: ClpXP protease specificity-enhancing factor [bacterium]